MFFCIEICIERNRKITKATFKQKGRPLYGSLGNGDLFLFVVGNVGSTTIFYKSIRIF